MTRRVHHATRKAADKDLAEGTITEQSHVAVIAGEMDLATARNIGADDARTDTAPDSSGPGTATTAARSTSADAQDTPPQPVSRISKDDRLSPCLCGCGKLVRGRFAAGHDMRMFRVAREHLQGDQELTDEQREYLKESGKMERVRNRLAEEEQRKAAKKGSRQ